MNILDYTYDKYLDGDAPLFDAHCHLRYNDINFKALNCGLLPSRYTYDKKLGNKNVIVCPGYHPWLVSEDNYKEELEIFKSLDSDIVGEIGLDFSSKYEQTKDLQLEVFKEICSQLDNKILSIHAVHATSEVMNILQDSNNIVIFHWFSGSAEELKRAIKMGCYFSCGPRMAYIKKCVEYMRILPENRMFLETDLPWDSEEVDAIEHENILNDFAIWLRDLREDPVY